VSFQISSAVVRAVNFRIGGVFSNCCGIIAPRRRLDDFIRLGDRAPSCLARAGGQNQFGPKQGQHLTAVRPTSISGITRISR